MSTHLHDPSEHAHHHDFAVMVERGEKRTRAVVVITIAMMIAELVTGYITGSLALTADGWHMATHAGALGLALFAYWFARTRSSSARFTFGTGKVYALAGYTSGVSLGVIALWMGIEAGLRLFDHPAVNFADALPIAIIGLVVNLVSAVLLGSGHGHAHDHDHADHGHHHDEQLTDHNLRAAYFHVLADALTSVLAIGALVAGEFAGIWWLDPAMGFVGGVLIAKWAVGLCRDAAAQLVDATPTEDIADQISKQLTKLADVQVADLHVWELAPGKRGCIVSLVSARPRDVDFYRKEILGVVQLAHLTVEIHGCVDCDPARKVISA